MSAPATPTSVIQDGLAGIQGDLLTVAGYGLVIGGAVLVVRKGWSLAKSFIGR